MLGTRRATLLLGRRAGGPPGGAWRRPRMAQLRARPREQLSCRGSATRLGGPADQILATFTTTGTSINNQRARKRPKILPQRAHVGAAANLVAFSVAQATTVALTAAAHRVTTQHRDGAFARTRNAADWRLYWPGCHQWPAHFGIFGRSPSRPPLGRASSGASMRGRSRILTGQSHPSHH